MKRVLIVVSVILLGATVTGMVWAMRQSDQQPTSQQNSNSQQTKKPKASASKPMPTFDKKQYSLTDPNSIWVIVNKTNPLNPISYVPNDLVFPAVNQRIPGAAEMKMRQSAAQALEDMFSAAEKAGVLLRISTAYRGYAYQKTLYDGYVQMDGQAGADKYSARPGYSEHQTGLAIDIRAQSNECPLKTCFGDMKEGKWLAAHAHEYGFLLRYTEGKENVTGYKYEPWHFRYIGKVLVEEMRRQRVETLEEFFGVSGGTVYR